MNADKELLEMAAKTVEIELDWDIPPNARNPWRMTGVKGAEDYGPVCEWNPLTDDGDAFRLAVNLSILCYVGETHDNGKIAVATLMYHTPHFEALEDANTDQYAAIRRAIVRAAAEIGKTL